jgi:hypothetical protein
VAHRGSGSQRSCTGERRRRELHGARAKGAGPESGEPTSGRSMWKRGRGEPKSRCGGSTSDDDELQSLEMAKGLLFHGDGVPSPALGGTAMRKMAAEARTKSPW